MIEITPPVDAVGREVIEGVVAVAERFPGDHRLMLVTGVKIEGRPTGILLGDRWGCAESVEALAALGEFGSVRVVAG